MQGYSKTIAFGLCLAGLTYLATKPLPSETVLDVHAVLLGGIAAVYVGFALADGNLRYVAVESVGALGFFVLAIMGLAWSVWFLIAGYILHGFWDLAHHNRRIPTDFAEWYIPLCLVYDVAVGIYLIPLA